MSSDIKYNISILTKQIEVYKGRITDLENMIEEHNKDLFLKQIKLYENYIQKCIDTINKLKLKSKT